jgi:hypothetical protein
MAERIQREFQKHGEVIQGWHIGNFEKWDDQYAAGVLQSAVLKDVNNTVITPGIGDTPLWASTPMGKPYSSLSLLRRHHITARRSAACRRYRAVLLRYRLSDCTRRADLRA